MASAMSSANGSLRMLQAAEFFCAEAEAKAKEWFGPDSHRTIWVDRKRLEVAGELQKIVENGGEWCNGRVRTMDIKFAISLGSLLGKSLLILILALTALP